MSDPRPELMPFFETRMLLPDTLDQARIVSLSAVPPENAIAGSIWIDTSADEVREQTAMDIARIMGVPPDVVSFHRPRPPRLPRWWLAFIRIGRAITDRL